MLPASLFCSVNFQCAPRPDGIQNFRVHGRAVRYGIFRSLSAASSAALSVARAPLEHGHHTVVPFMTSVLEHRLAGLLHGNRRGPGLGERLGIVDRVFVNAPDDSVRRIHPPHCRCQGRRAGLLGLGDSSENPPSSARWVTVWPSQAAPVVQPRSGDGKVARASARAEARGPRQKMASPGRGVGAFVRCDGGVLERYGEHGKQAKRSNGGPIMCFGRQLVTNAG